jgi:maltose alpha-D-glucosyltransferase/alpha-amylase
MTAASRYGTNSDLRRLFRVAHEKGLRIMLDLVPGHTSHKHPWYLASKQGRPNEYTARYIWTDDTHSRFDPQDPSIRGFTAGIGERNGLCAVNYYTCQPCLNYGFETVTQPWQSSTDSPEAIATREAMKDVMRFWLKMGCDGFRVDMAGSLVKNDPQQAGTIRVWQDIRAFLDREFPDAAMVAEWGRPDRSLQGGFHMDFMLQTPVTHYMDLFRTEEPYFSRRGRGNVAEFVKFYQDNYQKTQGKGLMCIHSSNHDIVRIAHSLDQEELKIAFVFLLTMPGAPFIYYGDEIGMRWIPDLISKEGSRTRRAGSRTPMQWDSRQPNDGFSDAAPQTLYLPIDPENDRPTVAAQMADENSLWHTVRALIRLRQDTPALQSDGDIRFLYAQENSYPLVYLRTQGQQTVAVVLNPRDEAVTVSCPLPHLCRVLYHIGGIAESDGDDLRVPAASATIFLCE